VRKNLTVFGLSLLLAGGSVLTYFSSNGADEEHLRQMLRLSAWMALLIYLVVFVTRPLNQLVGSSFSRTLLRNRRYFGITLAAVMSVHLVLLLIVNDQAFKNVGPIVYVLLFLMLLTSFDSAPAKLGPRNWRLLHKTGLYGLGFAYALAVGGAFLKTPFDPVYLALTILMTAAITIRVAAFWKQRKKSDRGK
jgi:DMSO/TMAO reductase YedYZ heme-binding membrane subunit